jgi:exonuclease III
MVSVLNTYTPTELMIDDVKDSFYEELQRIFYKFPKCNNKIVLGDFNVKVDREHSFKTNNWNECLQEINMIMELKQ